jgi:hypothetical protein
MGQLSEFKGLNIDWELTPEEAVTMYLEWGNNWRKEERNPVRSKKEYSNYFIVSTWENPPQVYLISRNLEEGKELARLDLPERLRTSFEQVNGKLKGVFPVTEEIKLWLEKELEQA